MDVFEMVVLIVAISVTAGLIRTWIKRGGGAAGAVSAEHDARIARLEERVRALETVVGDSSYELKQKLRELERT